MLESVILSFNRLRQISQHTFVELPALKEICLEDNLITKLDRRAFMNLISLRKISLRGNKLKNITDETFQNLPELEMYVLYNVTIKKNKMITYFIDKLEFHILVLIYPITV